MFAELKKKKFLKRCCFFYYYSIFVYKLELAMYIILFMTD